MFRALKNTQTEIMQSLLKFADEITGDSGQKPHCQSQSQGSNTTEEFAQIIRTMHLLHQRLEAQNNLLNEMFEMLIRLNKASTSGVNLRDRRAAVDLTSDVTIPSLQPISVPIDMIEPEATLPQATLPQATLPQATLPQATLPRTVVPEVTYAQVAVSKLQAPVDDEVEESLGEIEQEEEVEVDAEQEEEVEVEQEEEVEVDEEEQQEEAEQEEEGIEVEEWTYKGLLLFKDTNNTVYRNENGDVGEAFGTYDPVKKTLKKL